MKTEAFNSNIRIKADFIKGTKWRLQHLQVNSSYILKHKHSNLMIH